MIIKLSYSIKAKSGKYREVLKVKSRVKTRQVRKIWSQQTRQRALLASPKLKYIGQLLTGGGLKPTPLSSFFIQLRLFYIKG